MICSKITRKLPNITQNSQQEQLIIGISDYIPQHLKMNKNLSISIVGNKSQIINHILWNEFFAKTLLKEAYYYLLQTSFKDNENISAIFIKFLEKVYKVEEINEWGCLLRSQMIKSNTQPSLIQIQGFSNKGYIKKVNIFISKYPINNNQVNLVLNTNNLQVVKQINKASNQNNSSSIRTQKVLEQNNLNLAKQYKISYNTAKDHQISHNSSRKHTQQSYISANTKRSIVSGVNSTGNKQNLKTTSSKLNKSKYKKIKEKQGSKKQSKLSKQPTSKSALSKNFFSHEQIAQRISKIEKRQHQNNSVKVQSSNKTRQSVMSKIITSKQQQIIHLKQQIKKQQAQYDQLLYNQEHEHKLQVDQITKNVKDLLNNYENSQKQYINQNIFLKERVKVMEESLIKNNEKLDSNTRDLQDQVSKIRQHEQTIGKLNQTIKSLRDEEEQNRSRFLQENGKLASELKFYRQKTEEYKYKYEKIMEGMKSMLTE